MDEFEIIEKFFSRSTQEFPWVFLSVGDDAAILQTPKKQQMVISTDTLVEGIHFPKNTRPFDIGFKSLAVSLSDMAAMGAFPAGVLLSLTLPQANTQWLKQFAQGFFSLANRYRLPLIGGDTTRGPLNINTVLQGFTPQGKALLRSGANPGDLIYVTGTLGEAALALQLLQQKKKTPIALAQRLNRPSPRIEIGLALRDLASAAIDISDGFVADLKKILIASNVGAVITSEKIPLSSTFQKYKGPISLALTGGDDYELCFTIPKHKKLELEKKLNPLNCPITCIGEITTEKKLKILDKNGKTIKFSREGFDHFKHA